MSTWFFQFFLIHSASFVSFILGSYVQSSFNLVFLHSSCKSDHILSANLSFSVSDFCSTFSFCSFIQLSFSTRLISSSLISTSSHFSASFFSMYWLYLSTNFLWYSLSFSHHLFFISTNLSLILSKNSFGNFIFGFNERFLNRRWTHSINTHVSNIFWLTQSNFILS